ncbi:hypothetical protein GLW03_13355 [Halobacillus halophilus]|uniref:tetratricopeptide repeat protein n=1 Tax=Halobacillus halophilus TaxID=1570 RepID=UPI00136A7651|nr:tetratricopeptide repeat protein [Halobacillus halophilus]MYL30798.1 hypothetical protein [Halobacillus halophilus]
MNEAQQTVLSLFKQKQTDYDEHMEAIKHIWREYGRRKQPDIQDPAGFAAGLEYLASKTFLGPKISQKACADKYGVTSHKVSQAYRRLSDTTGDIISSYWRAAVDGRFQTPPQNSKLLDELVDQVLHMQTYPGNFSTELTMDQRFMLGDLFSSFYGASFQEKIELCVELFAIHPYHPDLYIILAEFSPYNHRKKKILTKAMINGENAMDPFIMKDLTGELWMEVDARPYLRAKAAYAEQLIREYDFDGGILHYRELLRLDEGDNQGIRYKLLPLYLEHGYYTEARALLDTLQESDTFFLFYEAILAYLTEGLTRRTKTLLQKADHHNPYVKDFVLHPKKRPKDLPDYYGVRDESEAAVVAADTLWVWNQHKTFTQAFLDLQ